MPVTRCVCRDVSFERLLEEWRRLGRAAGAIDLGPLMDATGFGTGCGMCRPYARKALRTGIPVQPALSRREFDALMREELTGART